MKPPIWNVWPKRDDVHTGIRLQYQFRYPLQSDNGCQQHPTSCNKLDAWKNKATDRPSNTIQLPDWNYNGVSQVTGTSNTFVGTSFVELLRQNGYHTIHCGKAHFGSIDTPGENPTHWGFEVNIAGHAAGGLATYLSEQNYGHTRDGKPYSLMAIPGLEDYWGTGIFATEALTREAIKALDKAKNTINLLSIYGTLCHPRSCWQRYALLPQVY